VIPLHHGEDLFNAAQQPKQRWVVAQAGHSNALSGKTARRDFLDYFASLLK